jgi:hypothetical protein
MIPGSCPHVHDAYKGDVILIHVEGNPITGCPVVIQHDGDSITLDIYGHDRDDLPDRHVRIPLAVLAAIVEPGSTLEGFEVTP